MGLTGALKEVAEKECPHCKKKYGEHSKKGFMRCLYTANFNLYNVIMELKNLKDEINKSNEGETVEEKTD